MLRKLVFVKINCIKKTPQGVERQLWPQPQSKMSRDGRTPLNTPDTLDVPFTDCLVHLVETEITITCSIVCCHGDGYTV